MQICHLVVTKLTGKITDLIASLVPERINI